jgi:redox-sensitive bicupin YhaK (pirin superfamily)
MSLALARDSAPMCPRAIAYRTRGRSHGSITRLMSPSDLGEVLKPFVFLDLVDHRGPPMEGSLHPHSGIATLTYIVEGAVRYIDPNNVQGVVAAGGTEWMQAGRGMWHGGGIDHAGRTRGFQLWIALPPELELGPTIGVFQGPDEVPCHGPVRVLLGRYGSAVNALRAPSPINYLAVKLQAGQRWRYEPPSGHTVLWTALSHGSVSIPDTLRQGELVAFEPNNEAVEFEALTDAEFVVGSAARHEHDLVLGYYSVHTSPQALRDGERRIEELAAGLAREGQL